MKIISIIFFILFISLAASAQDTNKQVKETTAAPKATVEQKAEVENKVVRLYKTKHYNVKKELDFFIKDNKAKLA